VYRKRAVVIFSGGIDSTTALYWARENFTEVYAITFHYGQKHSLEVEFSKKIAKMAGVKEHKIMEVDLSQIGGSALTQPEIEIPTGRDLNEISSGGIPATYVPFRNGIFISLAAAWAETLDAGNLVGGWNVLDFSGYPDCRREFLVSMEKAINLGTKAAVEGREFKIHFPLISLRKHEIIALGLSLGADYSWSLSCYKGEEIPCGECDSCKLRQAGWKKLNLVDHLLERLLREGKIASFNL